MPKRRIVNTRRFSQLDGSGAVLRVMRWVFKLKDETLLDDMVTQRASGRWRDVLSYDGVLVEIVDEIAKFANQRGS